MAAEYTIDAARRMVISRFTGDVTESEIRQHCRGIAEDPRFSPDFDQLVDITAGSLTNIHFSDLDVIRNSDPFSTRSRRALVARSQADYGVARMYGIMREGNIRVFRTLEEASAFLAGSRDVLNSQK